MTDEPPRKKQRGLQSPRYTTLGHPERYTHHAVAALRNIFPLKSGITPLTPPGKDASDAEKEQFRGLEAYQRRRFGESVQITRDGMILWTALLDDPDAFKKVHLSKKATDPALRFDLHALPQFQKVEEFFRSHTGEVKFVIVNGTEKFGGGTNYGCAVDKGLCGPLWKHCVEIAFQSLEPLLNPNYTHAEKLLDRCNLVSTILHETVSVVAKHRSSVQSEYIQEEPYFEQDVIPEL
ncbi:hypothetical protein NHQ30_005889 [Ciborinia camelliae]|nr:hypothetical protein NHQ30_005889 [Ciborinia camelliae]